MSDDPQGQAPDSPPDPTEEAMAEVSRAMGTAEAQTQAETPINDMIKATAEMLLKSTAEDSKSMAESAERYASAVARALMQQDAAAHLRRMQILAEAAFSLAVSRQAAGDIAEGEAIVKTANDALAAARSSLEDMLKPAG